MSIFASKCGFAILLAALCLGGQEACGQAAPVRYWIAGGAFGYGGSSVAGQSLNTYGDFPGFDTKAGGLSDMRASFPTGWFVGGEGGGVGLNGINQAGAFGSLNYQGVQFGYNFKGAGGSPVTFYAGFDTLKYNAPGIGGPLAPFSVNSDSTAGYRAHAGFEFQPAPNVSLSFGAGFTQLQSGRVDSDINSPLLPGESPIFIGGRR
ncbi:hypothetical protein [Bradyrhizobium lablabi]|uniref:hypothetical protein n=1 Tax=Bradyrhizobium lablabi TaxID=722472 RepID=UPI001BA9F234|nr:hypothetical protein [Bradyrhizobium lablabi]MBR0696349.1 hypothetical protein [Bradyrhizobium lablabi]